MDFNFPFPKRPTVCFRVNSASGVDRISALPDEVLRHILSFLTMKQTVPTSMLSKRWEGLWTSIPNLEFNDDSPLQGLINYSDYGSVFRSLKDFWQLWIAYVERILFYHDGREIQKCHFVCRKTIGTSNLYAWICAVIASNVQELIVGTAFFNVHQLPWTVFTCKTLRSLKLQGVIVLNLPTSISLPSLKTLSLSEVVYVDDASFQRLFSSCPVLEELSITRMDWDGVCIMNVSAPSLKRLFLHNMMPNFRGEPDQKIVIDSPMLDFLEVKDSTKVNYYSSKFSSSLVKVYIHGVSSDGLLRAISPVKHLALFASAIRNLHTYVPDWGMPVLPNLTKMELHVGSYIKWDLLPHLLESAPNLEVLFFPKGLVVPKGYGRGFRDFSWLRPEHVPECFLSHLKTIEIHKFVGKPGELRLIEYLLECSNVLDRMIIRGHNCTRNPPMQKELEQLQDEISRFPRASLTCELIF